MVDADQLEAGSETDSLIAERVMGWVCKDGLYYDHTGKPTAFCADGYEMRNAEITNSEWHPSRKIAMALCVTYHLEGSGRVIEVSGPHSTPGAVWRVVIHHNGHGDLNGCYTSYMSCADKLEIAICRAALKAETS